MDPASLAPADAELRRMLDLVRAADINMVRVGGSGRGPAARETRGPQRDRRVRR